METLEARSNQVFTKIINPQQRITTDLTGRFPFTSNRVNKYLFFLYEYDINIILVLPMKFVMDKEVACVFQDLHEHLTTRLLKPNYKWLDNEAYLEFQYLINENNIDYQLSPPGMHQHGAAEKDISTFKDHFIAGLFSTDSEFLIKSYNCILKKA